MLLQIECRTLEAKTLLGPFLISLSMQRNTAITYVTLYLDCSWLLLTGAWCWLASGAGERPALHSALGQEHARLRRHHRPAPRRQHHGRGREAKNRKASQKEARETGESRSRVLAQSNSDRSCTEIVTCRCVVRGACARPATAIHTARKATYSTVGTSCVHVQVAQRHAGHEHPR